MTVSKLKTHNYLADIVVVNKNEKLVLLVEIKNIQLEVSFPQEQAISQINFYLQIIYKNDYSLINNDVFAMIVDINKIEIYKYNFSNDNPYLKLLVSLPTSVILSHYDPDFNNKRIFNLYMETLVEAWLRDLVYHWKSEIPPGLKELAEIGLLSQIEGGKTYSQVNIGADTLH
ncbi:type I restriction enzyme HsdR N-terminal domain-containing protein [Nostoc sp. FACHB-110]|uniref:type I restriction enzyme HsdR N-terminal domain-containing protein n=1 Tax=Nostoc sp. FACHB-110 TaxID=2692834 RepID=UPI001682787C|nr:type I restriction enzyme HsdR N-terminal domain-containing protein [Nostoc sp. FACHB-110]MBD2435211.1 type I restriction enzyme HsdR N-terminal domain-containing protein [Nostoc sp. FACHB-110]